MSSEIELEPDRNDLAFWFPKIRAAGLPVPRTEIVRTELPLLNLLDGQPVPHYADFLIDLLAAADKVRYGFGPFFLRTGHTSGKHNWDHACYVASHHSIGDHVCSLVEESAMAGIFGLPTQTWVVRELLATSPIFTLPRYGNMPVNQEFRYFVRDGNVEHVQPYWPPGAVEQGEPQASDWQEKLATISAMTPDDRERLNALAHEAGAALGGFWSVDFLRDAFGRWWLTDCANGDESFKWEP